MVTVVNTAIRGTRPASHSKLCDTFRASDQTAVETQLESPSFINFNISNAVPAGFVAELIAERRPTGIEHGFRNAHCDLGGAHTADDDQLIFASGPRGLLVKMVMPCIGDLGVNRFLAF